MFKQITIVVLTDAHPLLDYTLAWPQKVSMIGQYQSNTELLSHAGILSHKDSYIDLLCKADKPSQSQLVVVPLHFRATSQGYQDELLTDISESEYYALTELIREVYPELVQSLGGTHWYLPANVMPASMLSENGIAKSQQAQEIEMLLYQNQINRDREARQKRPVSSLAFMQRKNHSTSNKICASDSTLMKVINDCVPVQHWLDKSSCANYIVLGEEAGDMQLEQIKAKLLRMLETGACSRVRVITHKGETFYCGSIMSVWYTKLIRYAFSKQAM